MVHLLLRPAPSCHGEGQGALGPVSLIEEACCFSQDGSASSLHWPGQELFQSYPSSCGPPSCDFTFGECLGCSPLRAGEPWHAVGSEQMFVNE